MDLDADVWWGKNGMKNPLSEEVAEPVGEYPELPARSGVTAVLETGMPATVYGRVNKQPGHLLIASAAGDWLFLNGGGTTIRCCLPGWDTGVDLTAADLRELGDYCHDMANRIEARS